METWSSDDEMTAGYGNTDTGYGYGNGGMGYGYEDRWS
jgi:hypothetical protein